MHIQKLDKSRMSEGYTVISQGIHPWSGVAESPFFSCWCVVEPGRAARAHKHQEHEVFFIVQGRGRMRVNDHYTEVGPGDVIQMAPFDIHELKNLEEDQDLIFLDVGWEDLRQAVDINDDRERQPDPVMHKKSLDKAETSEAYGVISQGVHPWPGVAEETPFSSCWCVVEPGKAARAHKHQEHESFLIVQGRGRMRVGEESVEVGPGDAIQMRPFEEHELVNLDDEQDLIFIDLCWEDMQEALSLVGGTETAGVAAGARVVLPVVPASGERAADSFDAVAFGARVHQRYLAMRGVQAAVLEESSAASDGAGAFLERLRSGGHLVEKEEVDARGEAVQRLYFPLSRFDRELGDFFREVAMDTYLQAHCDQLRAEGLPDVPVGAAAGEGVALPGFEGKVDPRFARAAAWASALEVLSEGTGIVPFFDAAESFLCSVLVPGLLLASDRTERLPEALRAVSRLEIEGGSAEALPERAAGFCLAYVFPEVGDARVRYEVLEDLALRELAEGWEGWLRDFDAKVESAFGGSLPGTGAWTEEQQRFFRALTRLCSEAAEAYEAATFSPQRASRVLAELVDRARRFGRHERPWSQVSGRYEEWRTAVAIEALAVKTLALLAAPLMPELAAELWRRLGLEGEPEVWEELPGFVYRRLQGLGEPLFTAA